MTKKYRVEKDFWDTYGENGIPDNMKTERTIVLEKPSSVVETFKVGEVYTGEDFSNKSYRSKHIKNMIERGLISEVESEDSENSEEEE